MASGTTWVERLMTAALAAGMASSVGCDSESDDEGQGIRQTHDVGGECFGPEEFVVPRCAMDLGPDASPTADAGALGDAGVDAGPPTDSGPEPSGDAALDAAGPVDAGAPDLALPSSPPECAPDLSGLGELSYHLCEAYCGFGDGSSELSCTWTDAGLLCYWAEWCGIGRRPAGAIMTEGAVPDLGAWLGAAAGLEAAAVDAFEALASQLDELGAPTELVADCRAAADDERRHAAQVQRLAQRYGADVRPWQAPAGQPPSLFELALENRVEGCVGETFGALVVAHQAERAQDPAVAETFAGIARDEAGHARLSWRIAAWLEPQLTAPEQAALTAASAEAVAGLNVPVMAPAARAIVGMPDAPAARAMAEALAPLWALSPVAALAA